MNLSVDSEYVDKRRVILGMTLHFSAQYLESIEKHYIAWTEIFISQGIMRCWHSYFIAE